MLTSKELDEKYYMLAFGRDMEIGVGKDCHVWDRTGKNKVYL